MSQSSDPFHQLLNQSYQLIESVLNDETVTPAEKVNIALKLLEISRHSSDTPSIPPSLPSHSQIATGQLLADYIQIENFLSVDEHQAALELAFANQDHFFSSQVLNHAEEHRKSSLLMLKNIPDFYEMMRQKLLEVRPQVLEKLQMSQFLVSWLEMQLTAHNHGDYYKIHNDAAPGEDTWNRVLTYVYYFYQEPKGFYGGELRLYNTLVQNENYVIQDHFQTIEPKNNSIVFFDSRCKHEVMPVICPSQKFRDSRFTVNGWIHR